MNKKNKKGFHANVKRLIAILLAVLMTLGLIASVLPLVFAMSSSEIQKELDALQEEADEIEKEKQELQAQFDANEAAKNDIVAQKGIIDQTMNLTMQEISNAEAAIDQYYELIAVKRSELAAAEHNEEEMLERYKLRIREMEESGTASYLDILFSAASFSEMLDRLDWIEEIRSADQKMLGSLMDASQLVRDAEDELFAAQELVEQEKERLMEKEQELLEESLAAQKIIDQFSSDSEEMRQLLLENELLEEETADRLAVLQQAYEEAKDAENEAARIKAAEEAARRKLEEDERYKAELKRQAEEEERRRQEEEARTEDPGEIEDPGETEDPGEVEDPGETGETNPVEPEPKIESSVSFMWPASGAITSPFGSRVHPVYGYELFHEGIDIDAWKGDPVYAAASGTVLTAGWGSAAGYYCTIAHADGFATMYMHFKQAACVSAGQYVSQGQVIGYVGDTGVATGAHLHFGVLVNGEYVNPMLYLP